MKRIFLPIALSLALATASCGSDQPEDSLLDEVFVVPTAEHARSAALSGRGR